MNDGADHEVEAGSPECLTVKGTITDFAALVEKDGALELVSGFALVGVTTRKWRICPTFKNVSGTQVGLTVDVVAFSALRAS